VNKAAPDPLGEAATGILAHMNADHVDGMILLAGTHAGIEGTEAAMTSVDRLGFSLRLKTNNRVKGGSAARCEDEAVRDTRKRELISHPIQEKWNARPLLYQLR
jgi:putative heme iron utilization protein